MNAQDYRADGYGLSQQIEQGIITRAERDVVNAYIVPLIGEIPTSEQIEAEPIRSAVMALAFLLVSQRSSMATRAGAKLKQTEQSSTPTYEDVLRQNAPTCVRYLQDIAPYEVTSRKVNDICGIFFKSNYFNRK